MSTTDDLADRLDAIGEELRDHVIDVLRAGLAGDEGAAAAAKAEEKRLARAQRAIEKAAAVLRGRTAGED